MGQIYIHIGLHKTGSSYLQSNMASRRPRLLKAGLDYPHTTLGLQDDESGNAHHFLAHAILGIRRGYTPDIDFDQLDNHVKALRAAFSRNRDRLFLLSSEEFSHFQESHIERLHQLMSGEDISIVVYLRRQDFWIESYYSQLRKTGRRQSINTILKQEAWRLDYAQLVDSWARYFGEDKIIVRPYPDDNDDFSIWSDFFSTLKVDVGDIKARDQRVNVSMSPVISAFNENVQRFGYDKKMRSVLEEIDRHFEHPKLLRHLTEEACTELLQRSKAGNRYVANKYCQTDDLFDDYSPPSVNPSFELSPNELSSITYGLFLNIFEENHKLRQQVNRLRKRVEKLTQDEPQ